MNVAYFGPWYGEFGWELLTWQAYCRYKSRGYDKSYVSSFPGMEMLYDDFAEFIPHTIPKRALDWRSLKGIVYNIPGDATVQVPPHKKYRVEEQEFIPFGKDPISKFDWLIHPRNVTKGSNKNYPKSLWDVLVSKLPGIGATIGTQEDLHIDGTEDLRGISLVELVNYMTGSSVVIGQSSGVMHLAALCKVPTVVWGDQKTYFGETLEKRYKDTWNPFKSKVVFIFEDFWRPTPDVITASVLDLLKTPNKIVIPELREDEEDVNIPKEIPIIKVPDTLTEGREPDELIVPLTGPGYPPIKIADGKVVHTPKPFLPPTEEITLTVTSDMAKMLKNAITSNKWFLTVSYLAKQGELSKLWHCWEDHGLPDSDVIPSLEHLKVDVAEKVLNKKKLAIADWG